MVFLQSTQSLFPMFYFKVVIFIILIIISRADHPQPWRHTSGNALADLGVHEDMKETFNVVAPNRIKMADMEKILNYWALEWNLNEIEAIKLIMGRKLQTVIMAITMIRS